MNKILMKVLLTILFISCGLSVNSQGSNVRKYLDSSGFLIDKSHAFFYSETQKDGNYLVTRTYFVESNKISSIITTTEQEKIKKQIGLQLLCNKNGIVQSINLVNEKGEINHSLQFDKNGNPDNKVGFIENKLKSENVSNDILTKGFATYKRYYDNGTIEDSIYVSDSGKIYKSYHFYETGNLYVNTSFNNADKKFVVKRFSESGNIIPDFIDRKAPQFPNGIRGWQIYLERNLNRDLPVVNGAPPGKYTVTLNFLVNKNGNVEDVVAENNPGYGIMEEAIRIIKNSPKWEPGIEYGKVAEYHHKQGITFVVSQQR